MIWQLLESRRRWVLIDINTQKDFLLPEGKACVRNHRRILSHIRRIVAWARVKGISVVSTCEVYPNNNGNNHKNYCIDGTSGQRKISYSLLENRISYPADGSDTFSLDILRNHRQIILHKRCEDPFEEPRIERLLSEIRADRFIIIGATAEGAVKATALGLLQRGKKVTIVVDAIGSHNRKEAQLALRKVEAKGAHLIDTRRLAGRSHLKYAGLCDCSICNTQKVKEAVAIGFSSTN